MKIQSVRIYRYDIPFVRPFVTSRFVLQNRSGLILAVEAANGLVGYGEIAPFPGFSRETLDDCSRAAVALARKLQTAELPDSPQELQEWSSRRQDLPPCVAFGFETAIADLCAQVAEVTLAQWLRASASRQVALNAVITANTTEEEIKAKCAEGYRTLKLKVGTDSPENDIRRVSEIRNLVGSSIRLRLDANCAYDFANAIQLTQNLSEHDIEYIEEPLKDASLTHLSRIRSSSPIQIAIDETLIGTYNRTSLAKAVDLQTPEFLESFDVAIVKPALMGSIFETIAFCERLAQSGKKIVVTSSLDTAFGVTAATHVACALQVQDACGLDTAGLLVSQLNRPAVNVSAGAVSLPNRTGLGVALQEHSDTRQYLTGIEVD